MYTELIISITEIRMRELLTRKNLSRAGWLTAGGFALSSLVEGLWDKEWGMGNELGFLIAVIMALLTGGSEPSAHGPGTKKD